MLDRYRQMRDIEKIRAFELRRSGMSYQTIADTLSLEAEDGRRFNRATIYRMCRAMPESPLDNRFEYHRMEEYDLPWEAGPYILKMWAWVKDGGQLRPEDIAKGYTTSIPSVRQARWWWRIHLIDPQLTDESVWNLAELFAQREWLHVFAHKPLMLADLEAYVAYRPWRPERKESYARAIREGRIPRINLEGHRYILSIIE